MRNLNVIQPYDDESLTYDPTTARYYLTQEYCKREFGANFRDDGVLTQRIRKNTRNVYSFIFSRVNTVNKPVVDFLLRRTEEGRKFMLAILTSQMDADSDSGYNDLTKISPVNMANGQVTPREEIKRNQVSVEAEQIFDNSDDYLGVRIGYLGAFPTWLFMFARNNS